MRRWRAEPVRVGTERQLLTTALPAFPRRNAPPLQHQNLAADHPRIPCNACFNATSIRKGSWREKPAGRSSFWGVRRKTWRLSEQSSGVGCPGSSSRLLQFFQHLRTYRWAPQKCWDKQGSLFHCPPADTTASCLWDWNTKTPRASSLIFTEAKIPCGKRMWKNT